MAAITPVIAYDISSASEIISHQRTGILVPFNDENKFADEIIDFIENPENRQTIAKNGKEFAEKFDIEKAVEKVIEILST
jgi:glycosyltransferase involved in cell wall biosynthesis